MKHGSNGSFPEDDDDEINSENNAMLNQHSKVSSSSSSSSGRAVAPDIPFCGFMSLQYYQPYFDVDTDEVIARLKCAAVAFKDDRFMQEISEKPDLYGPFWITTSLVFVVAVVSHFYSYVSSILNSQAEWAYDFQSVVNVASVAYTFVCCVPAAIWFLMKQYEQQPDGGAAAGEASPSNSMALNLVTCLCIYGYSLLYFIPATLLCLIPSELLAWMAFLAAAVVSALFLMRNLGPRILSYSIPRQHVPLVLAGLGAVQLVFMMTIKISFF